jgi:hypothetical protein
MIYVSAFISRDAHHDTEIPADYTDGFSLRDAVTVGYRRKRGLTAGPDSIMIPKSVGEAPRPNLMV